MNKEKAYCSDIIPNIRGKYVALCEISDLGLVKVIVDRSDSGFLPTENIHIHRRQECLMHS